MSPGIQTISRADLPLTVVDFDIRCPACGRPMVITAIDEGAIEDGRVPASGLRTGCSKEPPTGSARWDGWYNRHLVAAVTTAEWDAVRGQIYQWFDAWFRYRHVAPEVVAKRRRLKWRRAA